MHSSRMRTARSFTVSRSIRLGKVCPTPLDADPQCRPPMDADPPEADPPVNRMTHRCKNITLLQTSFAGGTYPLIDKIIRPVNHTPFNKLVIASCRYSDYLRKQLFVTAAIQSWQVIFIHTSYLTFGSHTASLLLKSRCLGYLLAHLRISNSIFEAMAAYFL